MEVRCPARWPRGNGTCHPGRLLMKIRLSGDRPTYVHPDNLIELYCDDCRRRMRREGRNVKRVVHRYDFVGSLIETLVVEEEDPGVTGA